MKPPFFQSLPAAVVLLTLTCSARAADFFVIEETATFLQPEEFEAGDRLIFTDELVSLGAPATILSPPSGGATYLFQERSLIATDFSESTIEVRFGRDPASGLTFTMNGTVEGNEGRAMIFNGPYGGNFNNTGMISSRSDFTILFESDFSGTFTNTGTISQESGLPFLIFEEDGPIEDDQFSEDPRANIGFFGNFTGTFDNSGSIAGVDGIGFGGNFTGDFLNSQSIVAETGFGVLVVGDFEGDFVNSGYIGMPENPGDLIRLPEGEGEGGLIRFPIEENRLLEFGVQFESDFKGLFQNSGTIASQYYGAKFGGAFEGTFDNSGDISGAYIGVQFDDSFQGLFKNSGTISSGEILAGIPPFGFPPSGVLFQDSFEGHFENSGTIKVPGAGAGFLGSFNGSLNNSGSMVATDGVGLFFDASVEGDIINSGTITGDFAGVLSNSTFTATLSNSGTIAGKGGAAISSAQLSGEIINSGVIESLSTAAINGGTVTGVIRNQGGRITGVEDAILLNDGNGTVVLSGPSTVNGLIDGGDGSGDVIRFENLRGVSEAKQEELAALAEADSTGPTSIVLFGETLNWINFEDIQVDLDTIRSYEELLSGTGFSSYGAALDNVENLSDELREFLNELNEVNEEDLRNVAANTSGQTMVSAGADYLRSQGPEVFSLFSSQFSSGNGPGAGSGLAANERSGLFTREIQVGVTINEPVDDSEVYVSGFVGSGTQDPDANQAGSTSDSTSIIFGRSEALTSQWRVGLWGGYTDYEASVDEFGSQFGAEAGFIGASAQYEGDYGFSNLVLGYGFHDQNTVRRDFLGNQMPGDAVGHQGLLHGQFGRNFYFGEESNLKASPYLGFAVSRLSTGGYTEEGSTAARLRFDSQTTDSVQSVIGINLSSYRDTKRSWIRPKVDAAWWHEFADAGSLGVSLASEGLLNPFQVQGAVSNRNRAVVQVGMEMGFDQWENVTFDATYFGTYGEDSYTSHGGALSAEIAF